MKSKNLPIAPTQVTKNGAPATGMYGGSPYTIDWSGLTGTFQRSALWQRLHHKRWHYVALATERCFIGLAIVDLGWTNTAFAYVFDRQQGKMLLDWAQDGIPGLTAKVSDKPTADTLTWFKHIGTHLRYEHLGGTRYQLSVAIKNRLQIDATLDTQSAAPFLTAIGPIANGGCAHSTVKSSAISVTGSAKVNDQVFDLSEACGSFDYSNGLLARHTEWVWASAHSPSIGFNLQKGYFGAHENVLWLDGKLIPLGNAHFDFDPNQPLQPWHIHTDDGLLNLTFQPEGARQARKNLIVAASYYIQPIGTFSGTVKATASATARHVSQLVGVTEDHQSRW
jgi:hypothetical protein